MRQLFATSNAVTTFMDSRGVCGPMVCAWFRALKELRAAGNAGAGVQSVEELGPTGWLVLAQHVAIRRDRAALLRRYQLQETGRTEFFALPSGNQRKFSMPALAEATNAPGYHYVSVASFSTDDDLEMHAVGVWSRADRVQFLDPNAGAYEFNGAMEFNTTVATWFSDHFGVEIVSGDVLHVQ